jgi:hypothetical protein
MNDLIIIVPDDSYSRNAECALKWEMALYLVVKYPLRGDFIDKYTAVFCLYKNPVN